MILSVYQSGSCYVAVRYDNKEQKEFARTHVLALEIFSVEGHESDLLALAKREGDERGIQKIHIID